MSFLSRITGPDVLRQVPVSKLPQLAREIRDFLISNVSKTGGHLGSNLGVVELTIALHRVFDSPNDVIIWDTGHLAYVHKILTGRQDLFPTLRQAGGLSGYPSRAESEHDWVENSHASTSLSWAYGMARAFKLEGCDRHVVAVIGDGALTGGMALEALNDISTQADLPLVIVVNDNGRSYTPTIGGLATQMSAIGRQLSALRTDKRYERFLAWVKHLVKRTPVVGEPLYSLLHGFKTGVRDVLVPRALFPDLGLKYVGPINGHDEQAVETALKQAEQFGGTVLVHVITEKGHGYKAAEQNEEDHFHAVGRFDEESGEPIEVSSKPGFTEVFSKEMVKLGEEDHKVVALTGAMLYPVGLAPFAEKHPDRVLDAGIAEQHMVTTAAGLAAAGMHPVVAVYSTFLNRAFDQVLLDVGLHGCNVTFVLDRAGITGPDGPSHHGMWDVSILSLVPGISLTSPRDGLALARVLREAVAIEGPAVIRYPKGGCPDPIPAVDSRDGFEILRQDTDSKVLIIAYGLHRTALKGAKLLADSGIGTTVIDPLWALPLNQSLLDFASGFEVIATLEDNLVQGGLGMTLSEAMGREIVHFGLPDEFIKQGSRVQILSDLGLSAEAIAERLGAQIS